MEIYETIEKRRTVRKFKGEATEEQLKKMIIAGTKAYSAGNRQPWEFILIDDKELLAKIAEHKYQQNGKISPGPGMTAEGIEAGAKMQKSIYQNCSAVAVCHKEGYELGVSAWACIQNMGLAATAEGLGCVPSSFWADHQLAVEKLLGLPADYKVATVMLVGIQDGEPTDKNLRPEFSWLHRNQFGASA